MGYVLGKMKDGKETVVCYGGRSPTKAERNYSVGDLESLALISGVKYFEHYLKGRHFKVFTDNTSLAFLLNLKNQSGRLARWLMTLKL